MPGQTLEITLAPYETVVLVGDAPDDIPPEFDRCSAEGRSRTSLARSLTISHVRATRHL